MKLRKLVVATISVFGLSLATSAFAVDAAQTATTPAPAPAKHHKHHRVAHHYVAHHGHHGYRDYRPMGCAAMQPCAVACPSDCPPPPCVPCVVPCVPRFDSTQAIMDGIGQAYGRSKPCPDWFNRVALSGGINFDGHWGNLSYGYMGENVARLSINDAYLNVTAAVNSWTQAFASVSYSDPSVRLSRSKTDLAGLPKLGKFSNVYNYAPDALIGTSANFNRNSFNMEQAYITFSNFNCWPVFVKVGKQYVDFGRYQIHPITRSMAQVLSETLRVAAEAGFVTHPCGCTSGLHGSIYAFENASLPVTNEEVDGTDFTGRISSHPSTNYGVALGYEQGCDPMLGGINYDIGVGYMYNMIGVNDVQYGVSAHRASILGVAGILPIFSDFAQAYVDRVGAIAAYGDIMSGAFSLGVRYTTALQRFSSHDLVTTIGGTSGARPWAADITGGYNFNCWFGRNQNVYLGYQASRDAVELFLPKGRWIAGYNVDVWPKANLGFEYNHDTDYSTGQGGTGNSTNGLALRVAVKFG